MADKVVLLHKVPRTSLPSVSIPEEVPGVSMDRQDLTANIASRWRYNNFDRFYQHEPNQGTVIALSMAFYAYIEEVWLDSRRLALL